MGKSPQRSKAVSGIPSGSDPVTGIRPPRTSAMHHTIRAASTEDIHHLINHREGMLRDMGIAADFELLATATRIWLAAAIPDGTYRGWLASAPDGTVAASAGLIVVPWPPEPLLISPDCGFVFCIYVHPAHRDRGLGMQLMATIHDWCRSQGMRRLVLNASPLGQSLYESMGYIILDESLMRLDL